MPEGYMIGQPQEYWAYLAQAQQNLAPFYQQAVGQMRQQLAAQGLLSSTAAAGAIAQQTAQANAEAAQAAQGAWDRDTGRYLSQQELGLRQQAQDLDTWRTTDQSAQNWYGQNQSAGLARWQIGDKQAVADYPWMSVPNYVGGMMGSTMPAPGADPGTSRLPYATNTNPYRVPTQSAPTSTSYLDKYKPSWASGWAGDGGAHQGPANFPHYHEDLPQTLASKQNDRSYDLAMKELALKQQQLAEARRQFDAQNAAQQADPWDIILEMAVSNRSTDIDPNTPGSQLALYPTDVLSTAKTLGLDVIGIANNPDDPDYMKAMGLLSLIYPKGSWSKWIGTGRQLGDVPVKVGNPATAGTYPTSDIQWGSIGGPDTYAQFRGGPGEVVVGGRAQPIATGTTARKVGMTPASTPLHRFSDTARDILYRKDYAWNPISVKPYVDWWKRINTPSWAGKKL